MPEQLKAEFRMVAIPDLEQQELIGPCSLCGTRRKQERRGWRITITMQGHEDEPLEYLACTRCRRALREVGEIAFGDALGGVLHFEGDAPY